MKRLKLAACLILLFTVSCGSKPEEEFNVETAVAQMQEGLTVETAVAEMNATLAAQNGSPAAAPILPTQTSAPSPTPSICFLNQTCQAAGIGLSVNNVQDEAEIGRHYTAAEGYKYLIIEVTIYNFDRESSPYYSTWFTLTDKNGQGYVAKTFAPSPEIKDGSINKGENLTGNIAFEIPLNTELFLLTYLPIDSFGNYEPLQIDLSS